MNNNKIESLNIKQLKAILKLFKKSDSIKYYQLKKIDLVKIIDNHFKIIDNKLVKRDDNEIMDTFHNTYNYQMYDIETNTFKNI